MVLSNLLPQPYERMQQTLVLVTNAKHIKDFP